MGLPSAINTMTIVGWSRVIFGTVTNATWTLRVATMCETACMLEIVLVALGYTKGDLKFDASVHYARGLTLGFVLPELWLRGKPSAKACLIAWALNELCRIPSVNAPSSKVLHKIAACAPILTFPLASVASSWAAFDATPAFEARMREGGTTELILLIAIATIIPTNILSGIACYSGVRERAKASLTWEPNAEEEAEDANAGNKDGGKKAVKEKQQQSTAAAAVGKAGAGKDKGMKTSSKKRH